MVIIKYVKYASIVTSGRGYLNALRLNGAIRRLGFP